MIWKIFSVNWKTKNEICHILCSHCQTWTKHLAKSGPEESLEQNKDCL